MKIRSIGIDLGKTTFHLGKIYHGRPGAAGEGGHMGIDINGPLCSCGKHGCIEVLASGPAIARRARTKLAGHLNSALLEMAQGNLQNVTSEMIGDAYRSGDTVAGEVIHETLDVLAFWLGNIVDVLDPDVIIIGGGVSSMLGPFLNDIRTRWRGACVNPSVHEIPVVLARYGEDAGIAGAAALVRGGLGQFRYTPLSEGPLRVGHQSHRPLGHGAVQCSQPDSPTLSSSAEIEDRRRLQCVSQAAAVFTAGAGSVAAPPVKTHPVIAPSRRSQPRVSHRCRCAIRAGI